MVSRAPVSDSCTDICGTLKAALVDANPVCRVIDSGGCRLSVHQTGVQRCTVLYVM